jgi:hypothetical protein
MSPEIDFRAGLMTAKRRTMNRTPESFLDSLGMPGGVERDLALALGPIGSDALTTVPSLLPARGNRRDERQIAELAA